MTCAITGGKAKWLIEFDDQRQMHLSSERLLTRELNQLTKLQLRNGRFFEVMKTREQSAPDLDTALRAAGISKVTCLKTNKTIVSK